MVEPNLSITLILSARGPAPGSTFTRHVVVRTIGELEAALPGRAYLWCWRSPMTEATRQALSLSELDAYSTAERYGFTIGTALPDRQVWRDKSLDAPRIGV